MSLLSFPLCFSSYFWFSSTQPNDKALYGGQSLLSPQRLKIWCINIPFSFPPSQQSITGIFRVGCLKLVIITITVAPQLSSVSVAEHSGLGRRTPEGSAWFEPASEVERPGFRWGRTRRPGWRLGPLGFRTFQSSSGLPERITFGKPGTTVPLTGDVEISHAPCKDEPVDPFNM